MGAECLIMKNRLAVALVSVSLVAGCAGINPVDDVTRVFTGIPTEETEGMSAEQTRLLRLAAQSEKIRGQGLLAGLGTGAVLSLLVCQDAGVACNVAVSVGGAALGYGAGIYVAKKREDAKNEQDGLRQSINGAQASLSFYQERVSAAERVVSRNRRRINQLNNSSLANEAARAAYQQEYENMLDDRARISGMSRQLENDITFMEAEISGRETFKEEDTAALVQRKEALERINDRMKEQLARMDEQFDRVPASVRDSTAEWGGPLPVRVG